MKDIEEIAEEHSIQDLGRISPAYQCGFTQGSNYSKKEFIDKACEWLKINTYEGGKMQLFFTKEWRDVFIEEFRNSMEEDL